MALDNHANSAILMIPRWGDAHQDKRDKGYDTDATLLHRKSLFKTAQPGRHPEKLSYPGRLEWAFSFWKYAHFLIDKSGDVCSSRHIPSTRRNYQPALQLGLRGRRTRRQDNSRYRVFIPAPSVSVAMPRERATSGKALPGHVRVAPASAVRDDDGLAPYNEGIGAVLPRKGELRSSPTSTTNDWRHSRSEKPKQRSQKQQQSNRSKRQSSRTSNEKRE